MAQPWIRDGKVMVDSSNRIILCDECPCGEQPTDCSGKVQQYLEARYAELDPVSQMPLWSLVGSYISDFSCSTWQEVSDSDSDSTNNQWTWLSPSTGRLLLAVPRHSTPYETVLHYWHGTYITATEIYNQYTGEHRVVGCKCTFDMDTHQCKQTFSVDTWASIAGLCPVRQPEEVEQSTSGSESLPPVYEYHEEWSCEVDLCARLKLTLSAYHYWYGGCLNGEGYTDWWTNTPPSWWWDYGNFDNWNYYYGFDKHLMIWRFPQNGNWYYSSISCDCAHSAQGELPQGVLVHDMDGICDAENHCDIRVMLWVRHYTEMESSDSGSDSSSGSGGYTHCGGDTKDGLWEEVASAKGDYTCPVWEKDGDEWNLVSPASGNLVMAYTRSSTGKPELVSDVMEYDYTLYLSIFKFMSATTIRNKETGAYKTIGCECGIDYTNRTCQTRLMQYDGVCIGGTLPAKQENVYRYGLCDVDTCSSLERYFSIMPRWYGGESVGECIVDTVDESGYNSEWSYSAFRRAYKWSEGGDSSSSGSGSSSSSGTEYAVMLRCDCEDYSLTDFFWLPATEINDTHRLCTASGVCNATCQKLMALKASARERGWTDHGSGILRHKRSRQVNSTTEVLPYLDLFSSDNDLGYNGASLVIVESPNAFYGIGCGCTPSGSDMYKAYGKNKREYADYMYYDQGDAPDGYWKFLPWNVEDGCTCVDNRKLALDYPDLFGIEDISYGTNTTYEVTTQPPAYNFYHPIVQCYTGYGEYNRRFVDFRTMCMIINTFDNKQQLNWISPAGSPFQSNTNQYTSGTPQYTICYDTITFTGHAPLFSRFTYEHPITHAQSSWDFSGTVSYYGGSYSTCDPTDPCENMMWFSGCITQEYEGKSPYQQASEFASQSCQYASGYRSTYDWSDRYYPFVDWNNGSCEIQQSSVESCTNGYEGYKSVSVKGTCANIQKGDGTTEKMGVIYWLQYIQTNKGIAVNGMSGFQPSVTRKEAGDHQTFCNASTDYGYYHDTTISAQLVDTDMHWCAGNEPEDWSSSSDDSSSN